MPALTSIIIVSFNTRELLRTCLTRVFTATAGLPIEVIVVDNASRDASADMVAQEFPAVRLIRSAVNLGFAAANNRAFEIASGENILLLNPDALLEADALARACAHLEANPRLGMGGGTLLDGAGRPQPSARQFPSLLNELLVLSGLAHRFPRSRFFGRADRTWDDSRTATEVDWVPGAFALIRREALRQVGFFDERFFLYYEEVDLCRRLREADWEIWYWPDVVVHHLGGESSKTVEHLEFSSAGSQLTLWRMRSELLYYRKHHGCLVTFLVAQLEMGWHRVRAALAALRRQSAKVAESTGICRLMTQAWRDTRAGSLSPARPW